MIHLKSYHSAYIDLNSKFQRERSQITKVTFEHFSVTFWMKFEDSGELIITCMEDVTATASLRGEWRGFLDILCTTNGSGGTKI